MNPEKQTRIWGHKESRKVEMDVVDIHYNDPNTANFFLNMCCCEMRVLYTPSCSKTQAHYITLHLSCQTH